MSFQLLAELIATYGKGAEAVGRALAVRLDVPFHEDCRERCLGYYMQRRENTWQSRTFDPNEPLLPGRLFRCGDEVVDEAEFNRRGRKGTCITEEVWTQEHWPWFSYDAAGAVEQLPQGITGVYYHGRSMNLVLIGPEGEQIGVRAVALNRPEQVRALARMTKFVPN